MANIMQPGWRIISCTGGSHQRDVAAKRRRTALRLAKSAARAYGPSSESG
jgi:hypothetical protein